MIRLRIFVNGRVRHSSIHPLVDLQWAISIISLQMRLAPLAHWTVVADAGNVTFIVRRY